MASIASSSKGCCNGLVVVVVSYNGLALTQRRGRPRFSLLLFLHYDLKVARNFGVIRNTVQNFMTMNVAIEMDTNERRAHIQWAAKWKVTLIRRL